MTGFVIPALPPKSPFERQIPSLGTPIFQSPDRGALSPQQIEIERRQQAETNAIRQAVDRIAQQVSQIKIPDFVFKLPQAVIDKIKENLVIAPTVVPVQVRPPVIRPPVTSWPPPLCC